MEFHILQNAIEKGFLPEGKPIIEATSGNSGYKKSLGSEHFFGS